MLVCEHRKTCCSRKNNSVAPRVHLPHGNLVAPLYPDADMSELLPVFLPHLSSCAVWPAKVSGREEEEEEACKFGSLAQMEVRQHASSTKGHLVIVFFFFFFFYLFCTLI